MFTSNDDDVALTTIARSVGEGLEDSFLETRELGVVCLWNSPIPSLLPLFLSSMPQYYSAMLRDGNLNPTRGYPAWPDPNGPDFTRSDKE